MRARGIFPAGARWIRKKINEVAPLLFLASTQILPMGDGTMNVMVCSAVHIQEINTILVV